VVSGDLDEYRVEAMADAPVDRYMFGTRLVTGSGAPTAELVYKLVAVADDDGPDATMRAVAKTSAGKGHRGGRKTATRIIGADGYALEERLLIDGDEPEPLAEGQTERALQVPLIVAGEALAPFDARAAREHHALARAELRPGWLALEPGRPALNPNRPQEVAP